MVQMAEKIENEKAASENINSIADIGKERIRRVLHKTKNGNSLGFRVFKLRLSNFKLWRGDGIENQEELEKQLDLLAEPKRSVALEENMLYELLLKSGFSLTTQIEKRAVGKAHYFLIDSELAIALSHLDKDIIKDILKARPQQMICLDSLFEDNDPLKTNTQLQFKDAGIGFHSI